MMDDVVTVQRWMTLDLWMALGYDPGDFDLFFDHMGFADAWAYLCQQTREAFSAGAGLPLPGSVSAETWMESYDRRVSELTAEKLRRSP
jgi:hypothetical protein